MWKKGEASMWWGGVEESVEGVMGKRERRYERREAGGVNVRRMCGSAYMGGVAGLSEWVVGGLSRE